jgi:Tfp pilus assembly protein PilF
MHDMALKNLEHAIKLDPNSISIHISRGVTYFSLEQYQKAVIDFSYVLEIDPNNHEAHNNLGAVLDAMGKSE